MRRLALIALLCLLPVLAMADTSDERPNGDQSIDTNFDTLRPTGGNACGGASCYDDINEDYATSCAASASGDDIGYDDCAPSGGPDYRIRFNMTDPTNSTLTASATQTVQVCAKKCTGSGSNDPTINLEVYCSGDTDGTPQFTYATPCTLTSTTTQLCTFTFTDSDVSGCSSNTANIELALFCDGGAGGPSARSGCGVDLMEWQADHTAAGTRRIFVVD